MLNNNQINTVLNTLYSEFTGEAIATPIPTKDFIDTGKDANALLANKEQFTKSLINRLAKNMFTDTEYRGGFDDIFFEDSEKYGAIVQCISIEMPDVQESHVWTNFVSGETTVGTYKVFLPIINAQIYGKSVSWELPVAISDDQWNTALKSEEEFNTLVNYVFLAMNNKISQHFETLNMTNRNNFIAEKIHYQNTAVSNKGLQVVNILKLYHDNVDSTVTTVNDFLKKPDCLRYASKILGLYMDYLRKPTTLFNTEGKVKFISDDRFVCQILSDFKSSMDSVALSNTFNEKFVELPYHRAVPYWQTPNAANGSELTFNSVSSINVALDDSTTIKKSGIIAFMCDKWAIIHTIINHRIAAKYFEPEGLTQYYYQNNDRYINNLSLNACVFTLENVTSSTNGGK